MVKPRPLGGTLQEIPDELGRDAAAIDRLLDALPPPRWQDAETAAEEFVALRLVRGIVGSTPTEAELTAVDAAHAALVREAQPVERTRLRLVDAGADAPHPGESC